MKSSQRGNRLLSFFFFFGSAITLWGRYDQRLICPLIHKYNISKYKLRVNIFSQKSVCVCVCRKCE